MHIALIAAGTFSILLGILHFSFPVLLDFRGAIPLEGPPLKPFQLSLYSYRTLRTDVRGIACCCFMAAAPSFRWFLAIPKVQEGADFQYALGDRACE